MVSVKVILGLVALGAEALAATSCSTKSGTVSVKRVPTTISTKTTTVTQTKKTTKTTVKTVTPPPVTVTRTTTSSIFTTTTAAPGTVTEWGENVYRGGTSTYTSYNTVATVTSTETSTSTVTTPGETILPPAGFTAIKDTPGYAAKRDVDSHLGKRQNSTPKRYPQQVNCVYVTTKTAVKTVTSTVSGKDTTLKPATTTKTSVVKTTVVYTQNPPASTTAMTQTLDGTFTKYAWVDQTATETSTATVQTTVEDYATVAACGPSNMASTANGGKKITNLSIREPSTTEVYPDNKLTAEDCCVICQFSYNCQGFIFQGTTCTHVYSKTCSAGQFTNLMFKTSSSPFAKAYTLGNGPCGLFQNAGSNDPM